MGGQGTLISCAWVALGAALLGLPAVVVTSAENGIETTANSALRDAQLSVTADYSGFDAYLSGTGSTDEIESARELVARIPGTRNVVVTIAPTSASSSQMPTPTESPVAPPPSVPPSPTPTPSTAAPTAPTPSPTPSPVALPVFPPIRFEGGSTSLTTAAKKQLGVVAEYLLTHPSVSVVLSGHTDNGLDPQGRRALSQKRAKTSAQVLIDAGVQADRIALEARGDTDPVASNNTQEGRVQNRRVEFELREV